MNFDSLKIFFRNVQKQRVMTVMNVLGLSLGMTIAILVGLWSVQEFSYDNFHQHGDRIYRILQYDYWKERESKGYIGFGPMGETAKEQIPEIEAMCRIVNIEDTELRVKDLKLGANQRYYEQFRVVMADKNFFDFFTFRLKEGQKDQVLHSGDGMVIDQSTAALLFPGEDAVGKVVSYADRDWKVSGIMEDMPANSHIQANIIVPFWGEKMNSYWGGAGGFRTYFLLRQGADIDKIGNQLTQIQRDNLHFDISYFGEDEVRLALEPLRDIHLGSESQTGKDFIIVLIVAAVIVLLISCVNFSSLFISVAFLRARATGVRKTLGANRTRLIIDFYRETAYYVLLAMGFAILLTIGFAPTFSRLLHTNMQIDFGNLYIYLFLVLLGILTIILAGTFPAFYMTRFNVVQTLVGQFKGNKLAFLQKSLLVTQFTIALACLLSVFFIRKQVDTMTSMALCGDKENIFYVKLEGKLLHAYNVVREELMKESSVVDVTQKNCLPQDRIQAWAIKRKGSQTQVDFMTEICRVEWNYFDFMHMELVAGENNLNSDFGTKNYCVLNETAVHKLGLENPVGHWLDVYGIDYIVRAVVKDSYTKILYNPVEPQVYFPIAYNTGYNYLFVKVQGDPRIALKRMQKIWEERMSEIPFDYGFLDEAYELLYQKEIGLSEIFSWFFVVTLLVSVSGLFNMSCYAVGRRVKEIGLRKVNGATQFDLLLLLSVSFVLWIITAFFLACPLAWMFISYWQQGFVVKTPLSWWIFVVTGFIAVVVTLLTVSYQTIRTSRVNPVEVLKNE